MIKKYSSILLLMSVLLMFGCNPQKDKKALSDQWITLFNGKDLKDWDIKIAGYPLNDNFGNTFRVEDSLLKVSYDQYGDSLKDRYGHIFYKDKFSAYLLVAEYRFYGHQVADGPGWAYMNNGLMLHCQSPESMLLKQDYPISLECQLLGSDSTMTRTNANVCTPGTEVVIDGNRYHGHCYSSDSDPSPGREWTHVEVLVLGDSVIKQIVNTDTVLTYTKPIIAGGSVNHYDSTVKIDGTPLKEGYIALQSESFPTEFRMVKLFNLEPYMDHPKKLKAVLEQLSHRKKDS
ncbi:MAG TPA: DUF1080 domain-containing protein [Chitinophagaceae bacterium]|nr:DUF1080 domain-containing protein [Chitinophagaceae bacterium]